MLLVLHGDRVAIEEAVTENRLRIPEVFATADGPHDLPSTLVSTCIKQVN
jgi:hypothetical protein